MSKNKRERPQKEEKIKEMERRVNCSLGIGRGRKKKKIEQANSLSLFCASLLKEVFLCNDGLSRSMHFKRIKIYLINWGYQIHRIGNVMKYENSLIFQ